MRPEIKITVSGKVPDLPAFSEIVAHLPIPYAIIQALWVAAKVAERGSS